MTSFMLMVTGKINMFLATLAVLLEESDARFMFLHQFDLNLLRNVTMMQTARVGTGLLGPV